MATPRNPFLTNGIVPIQVQGRNLNINGTPLGRWATGNMSTFLNTQGVRGVASFLPNNSETEIGRMLDRRPGPPPTVPVTPAEIPVTSDNGGLGLDGSFGRLDPSTESDPRLGAFFNSNGLARQLDALRMQYMIAMMNRGGRR